ncbi:MAG: methyltransferase domain-containing protein [Burkholderiales bacterium]|nr:methyltransferase domain-containing protein [Burkholderiales bacterium]
MPARRLGGACAYWVLAACVLLAAGAARSQTPAAADPPRIGQPSRDSVWVPTPERVIRRMLQMADVTEADLVVDLGSGDGRIPIYAARHFGARAVGVELEENLVRYSIARAEAEGVAERARFVRGDLFDYDLAGATVIALYIGPSVMQRLKPRLLALAPGTRVVSHFFDFGDWTPDETIRVEDRTAHLWVVPADVRGCWRVEAGADRFSLAIEQVYQKIDVRAERNGRPVPVLGARLRGAEIEFTVFDPQADPRSHRGRVEGERMRGTTEAEDAPTWSAVRTPCAERAGR